jgi:putative tryptophan/tyrosine transport system substrate-binding protein
MVSRLPWLWLALVLLPPLAWPAAIRAESPPKVVVIETMPVPAVLEQSAAFRNALVRLPRHQGSPPKIRLLEANGDHAKAEALLRNELKAGRPDLVVTFATLATQAAHGLLQGTDIPILFAVVADPVGAGVIREAGKPSGTNITGRIHTIDRRTKLELVLRLLKPRFGNRPVRFGIIHSSYQSAVGDVRELKAIAARRDDVEFITHEIPYATMPEGLPKMLEQTARAIKTLESQIDFWWQPTGPMAETTDYTQVFLAQSRKMIAFGNTAASVKLGALLAATPDPNKAGQELAQLAEALLSGTPAGSLPVVPSAGYTLSLNLTTALGEKLVVPSDLLELAGQNIYR